MKVQSSPGDKKRGILKLLGLNGSILCSLAVLAAPATNCGPAPAIPCNVQTVLAAKCQTCHSDPVKNGAPFPLMTYAQTQENAPGWNVPKWQRMRDRVNANTMPPVVGGIALTSAERSTLTGWFNANAPAGTACP
ncbi:MAG TPA: hypothetical protein VK524_27400 [Polyangiaceae bacterium]|nr:hypothetical protein [Polyangiaceae bacterium]